MSKPKLQIWHLVFYWLKGSLCVVNFFIKKKNSDYREFIKYREIQKEKKSFIIATPRDASILRYFISCLYIYRDGIKSGSYWFLFHVTLYPEQLLVPLNVLQNMSFNLYLMFHCIDKPVYLIFSHFYVFFVLINNPCD